jgi:hypothetical protein
LFRGRQIFVWKNPQRKKTSLLKNV